VTEQPSFEVVEHGGWQHCARVANDEIELIATTDVGPRIVHLGVSGDTNLLGTFPETLGLAGGNEWRSYGGHRLWHAPEATPRTYTPDNEPVEFDWDGRSLTLRSLDAPNGIAKEIALTVDPASPRIEVRHRLTNQGPWPVELAPWAITVMAQKGLAVIPHEDYVPHPEALLPARPLVLWPYTDMSDPRWTWESRFLALRQDPSATTKQKVGVLNTKGWAAYVLGGVAFIKRYAVAPGATYPDMGCNTETFTDGEMLELETLGPLARIEPGRHVDHVERWQLARVDSEQPVAALAEAVRSIAETD
jgi:hypothetical protein